MGQMSSQDYSVHLVDRLSISAPRRLDYEKLAPPPAGVNCSLAILVSSGGRGEGKRGGGKGGEGGGEKVEPWLHWADCREPHRWPAAAVRYAPSVPSCPSVRA